MQYVRIGQLLNSSSQMSELLFLQVLLIIVMNVLIFLTTTLTRCTFNCASRGETSSCAFKSNYIKHALYSRHLFFKYEVSVWKPARCRIPMWTNRTDIRSQCCCWTHLLMFAGNMYRTGADNVNAILEGAHSLCIFRSVAFIRCNGVGGGEVALGRGALKLWMKNHSVADEGDADYSSLLFLRSHFSAEGFHTRGMRTVLLRSVK